MEATSDTHDDVSEKARSITDTSKEFLTYDIHDTPQKIQRAKEVYKDYARLEEEPRPVETIVWCIHSLCTYFVHTFFIPIVFPLIISQTISLPTETIADWSYGPRGFACEPRAMLYQALIQPSITVNNFKCSPLHWTSISWAAGILLSGPILVSAATHLDHGQNQHFVFAAATGLGAVACFTTGFFKTPYLLLPYVATVVVASSVGFAAHTRHFGLMLRGFSASATGKHQFPIRRAVASWLSLYATSAGSFGAAIIAAFTYRMIGRSDKLTSLWVVSIFSGLKWFVGIVDAFVGYRRGAEASPTSSLAHVLTIFKYPHAAGSLVGIFFASFSTSCLFTGGLLYVFGELCFKPILLLCLWLIYFIFPLFSLPLLHPLQLIIQADAVRMQLLGLLLSALTSGAGFYFRHNSWQESYVLVMTVLQSMAAGILHAFGRVLLVDCSPAGKEGGFAVWFAWVKAVGMCGGFALASAFPGNVQMSFGVAFCTVIAGVVVLIFGNISNLGGAVAAGHVKDAEGREEGSPVHGFDKSYK